MKDIIFGGFLITLASIVTIVIAIANGMDESRSDFKGAGILFFMWGAISLYWLAWWFQ